MASIQETHAGVARVTPHGQLRPLHRAADDEARTDRPGRATAPRPGPGPVRSITRGEAEDPATGPGSNGPRARKRQHPPAHKNRVFVTGSDGAPLMPCTVRRARQLIDAGRVRKRDYRPFTIHLKDRRAGDGKTILQRTETRCTPGRRRTGIAVVIRVHGIRSGDLIEIRTQKGNFSGIAQVEAARQRVSVRSGQRSGSTSKATRMRRVAGRDGYRKSE